MSEDVPDENLWEDPEALKEHWDKVREKQERKFKNPNGGGREQVPQAGEEMESNEYASALRG